MQRTTQRKSGDRSPVTETASQYHHNPMQTSQSARIARAICSNWLGMGVTGAVSFLLAPFLIHRLGLLYYGMWVMVGSVIGYYGLLDIGMSGTLQRFVAHYSGADKRDALTESLASALALSAAVAVIICASGLVSMFFLPRFFHVDGAEIWTFRYVLLLTALAVAISFPARTTGAYLRGLQRFDLTNAAAIATTVLRAAAIVGALLAGYGVVAVAAITLLTAVLTFLMQAIAIRQVDRGLALTTQSVSWSRLRELFNFSIFVAIMSVGDYFRFNLDSIVIARCLSLALVTPFAVAGSLISYFMSAIVGVSGPVLTEMSRLYGLDDKEGLKLCYLRATRLTCLASVGGGALLIFNGRMLFHFWLGSGFESSYLILVVLTVSYVTALAQSPSIALFYAQGRHKLMSYWTVAEGIVNLALSIWLASRLGVVGVALGTAIPMVVTKLTIQPWLALHVSGLSLRQYLADALRPGLIVGVASGSLIYGFGLNRATTLPTFLALLVLQGCVFLALAWLFGMKPDEKILLHGHLRQLFLAKWVQALPRGI